MFEQVARALLAGEFVCPISHRDEFHFLSDEGHRQDIVVYLGRIGLKLIGTRHGGAFYAAHTVVGGPERRAAKEVFGDVRQSLRPIVSFLTLIIHALNSDDAVIAGTVLETNRLMGSVDANPSLRNELQTLAAQLKLSGDGTDRVRLERVLKTFKDRGYLCLVNSEREIYQITGKIEYLFEVIDFLMEYEGIQDEETDLSQLQGQLL